MPHGRSCSTTSRTEPEVNLATETLLRLAEHPNIVGLKDCGADRAQSIDLLKAAAGRLPGADRRGRAYYEAITDGADGAILLSAHVETDSFAAVHALCGKATATPRSHDGKASPNSPGSCSPSPARRRRSTGWRGPG